MLIHFFKDILFKIDVNFLINLLFLYNEVYLDIIDFEFNENENNFFVVLLNEKNDQLLEKNSKGYNRKTFLGHVISFSL